jgi:hypothetical protein
VKIWRIAVWRPPFDIRARWKGENTYLVPYLPVTPTFLVLFVILAEAALMNVD